MVSGVGMAAALETAFNSAVQAGLVQTAIASALGAVGSGVSVMAADPVQAQRFAVYLALQEAATALQLASDLMNSAPPLPGAVAAAPGSTVSSSTSSCGGQDIKVWYPVGIAFIIFASVTMLVLVGVAAFRVGVSRGSAQAVHPGKFADDGYDKHPPQYSPPEKVHPEP